MGRRIASTAKIAAEYSYPPPAPSPRGEEPEIPLWHRTLRFEDAPTILTVEDATRLCRCGTTPHVILELIKAQRIQTEAGNPPADPFPYISDLGRGFLIENSELREWLKRKARR